MDRNADHDFVYELASALRGLLPYAENEVVSLHDVEHLDGEQLGAQAGDDALAAATDVLTRFAAVSADAGGPTDSRSAIDADAARYHVIREAFFNMKTSTAERFLDCLLIEGEAHKPLDQLVDAYRATRDEGHPLPGAIAAGKHA